MAKSRGLGKGLEALITENVLEETEDKPISEITINVNEIEPNAKQPRKSFDEDKLMELTDSIRQYGVIQPLIVSKKGDYYNIIAGERRWRAAKRAGIKDIPVLIKDYSSQEILEISLIENIQREDLNSIEEAKAYERLIKEFKLKQEQIAVRVSKSRSAIANSLRLLNLNEKVQQMVVEGLITSGHARALLGIEDKQHQYNIALKIIDEELSVRETEKLIKNLKENKTDKNVKKDDPLDPIFRDIEDRMKEIMGTKVQIIKGKKKSKIEIEYYSDEDLERIMNLFENIK